MMSIQFGFSMTHVANLFTPRFNIVGGSIIGATGFQLGVRWVSDIIGIHRPINPAKTTGFASPDEPES
jgi:hypothetical protein